MPKALFSTPEWDAAENSGNPFTKEARKKKKRQRKQQKIHESTIGRFVLAPPQISDSDEELEQKPILNQPQKRKFSESDDDQSDQKSVSDDDGEDAPPLPLSKPMQVETTPAPKDEWQTVTKKKTKRAKVESMDTDSTPNEFRQKLVENLKGSRFRFLNEQLYSAHSREAMKLFSDDKDAFVAYHEGYRHQIGQWPLNPLDRLAKNIQKLPTSFVVADFGCGEARLAKSIPQQCYSLDLVALEKDVIACDMAETPLKDKSVDVAVYCLSLMGTNLKDFFLEANRVLRPNGLLKIAEVASRFENPNYFISCVRKCGFELVTRDLNHKLFYFFHLKKTRDVAKGDKKVPEFSLKPCLYKRR